MSSCTRRDRGDKPRSSGCLVQLHMPKAAFNPRLNISKRGFNIFQDISCSFPCFPADCHRRVPPDGADGLWQQMLWKKLDSWVSPWWGDRIHRKQDTSTLFSNVTPSSPAPPPAHAWVWACACDTSLIILTACDQQQSTHSAPPVPCRPCKALGNCCQDAHRHTWKHSDHAASHKLCIKPCEVWGPVWHPPAALGHAQVPPSQWGKSCV